MDPLSLPKTNQPSRNDQSSEIVPRRQEEECNNDTVIITNNIWENLRYVEYTRFIQEAWTGIKHAMVNRINVNEGNKWGQDMLDKCLVHSTKALCWYLIYILIILLSSLLFTALASLIPQQNSIQYPAYWWDVIIPATLGNSLYYALNTQVECTIIFRFKFLNTFGFFFATIRSRCVSSNPHLFNKLPDLDGMVRK